MFLYVNNYMLDSDLNRWGYDRHSVGDEKICADT